jgi:hypothetical protein
MRLIGLVLMEHNEWKLQHGYMPQHTMTEVVGGWHRIALIDA